MQREDGVQNKQTKKLRHMWEPYNSRSRAGAIRTTIPRMFIFF